MQLPRILNQISTPLLCALFASVFFFSVYDPKILNPQHIEWLLWGDAAQHLLGWQFFRNEPWSFPLGLINNFQYPQGTSIVYTDSIPLIALLLKPFSSLLSNHFQYLGLWLLVNYILQGYFSALVLSKLTSNQLLICLGSMLFIMNSVLLQRAGGHQALTAHWLILAALNLYFLQFNRQTILWWMLLIVLAALIHFYLLLMVLMIWFSYFIQQNIISHMQHLAQHCRVALATLSLLLLVMWIAGYFVVPTSDASSYGYGVYSMNLLAPINTASTRPYTFLKGIPFATPGQYEGNNYLGVGCIILLFLAAFDYYRNPAIALPKQHYALLFVSIVLTLLALSNIVAFGEYILFELPLPDFIDSALGIVRSSGRLFWPVNYILSMAAIAILTRSSTKQQATAIMVVIVSIQLIDFAPHYQKFNLTNHSLKNPLRSPQWSVLAKHYKHIAIIPPTRKGDDYIPFALLASDHAMSLNIGYTARSNKQTRKEYAEQLKKEVSAGKYRNDTLYVFRDTKALQRKKSPPKFHTKRVDGVLLGGHRLHHITHQRHWQKSGQRSSTPLSSMRQLTTS